MTKPPQSFYRKWLGLFLIIFIVGSLTVAINFVSAQTPTIDSASISAQVGIETKAANKTAVKETKAQVLSRLKKSLVKTLAVSLKKIALSVTQSIAESALSYLESGGVGQEPIWESSTWQKWGKDVGEAAASEFLSELSTVGAWGNYFDICEPQVDLKVKISLSVDASSSARKHRLGTDTAQNTRCDFSKVKDNWVNFYEDTKNKFTSIPEAASFVTLDTVVNGFEPKQSEVGTFILGVDAIATVANKKVDAAEEQRREAEGYKAETNITGETVKNPPGTGKQIKEEQVADQQKAVADKEFEEANAVITEIPEAIAETLLNTALSSRFRNALFKRINEGYLALTKSYSKDIGTAGTGTFDFKAAAAQQIQQIKNINFTFNSRDIDYVSAFSTCEAGSRGPDNCVMDQKFADVVRRGTTGDAMTVREAVEAGDLDGKKPFISDIDSKNPSDNCYLEGYCYSNLAKLRRVRIIPIGWELAAKEVGRKGLDGAQSVTLNFLMDCFDNLSNNDDCKGFEKLVDPNWILKHPKARCEALGYSSLLLANGTDERAEYCADLKSCVSSDENGNCNKYAYCAAEKNTWNFGGKSCPSYADSCMTLKTRDNKAVSYLLNTVERTGCSESTVGCQPYSSWMKADSTEGQIEWEESYPTDYLNSGSAYNYFNSKLTNATCKSSDEGCSQLLATETLGVNLAVNSSFDDFEGVVSDGDVDIVTGWRPSAPIVSGSAYDGTSVEVREGTTLELARPIAIAPKNYSRYFLFSAQVRLMSDAPTDKFIFQPRASLIDREFLVVEEMTDIPLSGSISQNFHSEGTPEVNIWTEINYVIKLKPQTAYLGLKLVGGTGGTLVDNVYITELKNPFELPLYTRYGANGSDYIKKAPDYYACYDAKNSFRETENMAGNVVSGGTPIEPATKWYSPVRTADINYTNDNSACSNFAKTCSAEEVGCMAYTPTNGGRIVSAVASLDDVCDKGCSGYSAFSQPATRFVDSQFPLYFIPTTAKTCPADQVSCEEFTNLDELAGGGEKKEYYSSLRQCRRTTTEKPELDSQCSTYYTWIGSAVNGYQLQSFVLERGDSAGPRAIRDDSETCNADTFSPTSNPSCRQFYDQDGRIYYHEYDNVKTCSADCHPYRRTLKYDSATACESKGGEWQSDECLFYAIPSESVSCQAQYATCREYRGNSAGDTQILLDSTFEENVTRGGASLASTRVIKSLGSNPTSFTLPRQIAEGEEYSLNFDFAFHSDTTENSASVGVSCMHPDGSLILMHVLKIVRNDNSLSVSVESLRKTGIFSNGNSITVSNVCNGGAAKVIKIHSITTSGQDYQDDIFGESMTVPVVLTNVILYPSERESSIGSWTGGTITTEAIVRGGHSLLLDSSASSASVTTMYPPNRDEQYIVSFWAKNLEAGIDRENKLRLSYGGASSDVTVKSYGDDRSFHYYVTDLMTVIDEFSSTLNFALTDGSGVYIDNVKVERMNDVQYLLADSWSTPAVCDQNFAGQYLPQAQLGCQEYTDSDKAVKYLKGFRSLCRDSAVGCRAFIDTKNSTSPVATSFNVSYIDACQSAREEGILGFRENCTSDLKRRIDTYCAGAGSAVCERAGITGSEWATFDNNYTACNELSEVVSAQQENGRLNWSSSKYRDWSSFYAFQLQLPPEIPLPEGKTPVPTHYTDNTKVDQCREDLIAEVYCKIGGQLNSVSNWGYDAGKHQCITSEDQVTIPADNLIYLVKDKNYSCAPAAKGCTKLGTPERDSNLNIRTTSGGRESWVTNFYLLNPDNLTPILCSKNNDRCDVYYDKAGSPYYFRDPGKRVCVYKAGTGGGETGNWYVKGEKDASGNDILCDNTHTVYTMIDPLTGELTAGTNPITVGGSTKSYYGDGAKQLIHASDPDYYSVDSRVMERPDGTSYILNKTLPGYVGECLASNDKCTAFVEPSAIYGNNAKGEAYYQINDDSISDCSSVNKKKGCLLFNDTSKIESNGQPILTYSTSETYRIHDADDPPRDTAPQSGLVNADGLIKWLFQEGVECSAMSTFCPATVDCFTGSSAPASDEAKFACAFQQFLDAPDAREVSNPPTCTKQNIACYTLKYSPYFNNSNRIIKVSRDRECAQWYDCQTGSYTYDPSTNKETFVCQAVGLCDKASDTQEGPCQNFVSTGSDSMLLTQNKLLNADNYRNRPTSWNSLEYSGYSIADQFPLQFYDTVNLRPKSGTSDIWRLVHIFSAPTAGSVCKNNAAGTESAECTTLNNAKGLCVGDSKCVESFYNKIDRYPIKTPCTSDATCQTDYPSISGIKCSVATGQCYKNNNSATATYNLTGNTTITSDCRSYPKASSPFPLSTQKTELNNVFNAVNICQSYSVATSSDITDPTVTKASSDCGCFYTEMTYGRKSLIKYYENVPTVDGFCQDYPEKSCVCIPSVSGKSSVSAGFCPSNDCRDNPNETDPKKIEDPGTCLRLDATKAATQYRGWQGYCLQYDQSLNKNGSTEEHPCLLWYPLGTMAGLPDMNNNYVEAGYNPGVNSGSMICMEPYGYLNNYKVKKSDDSYKSDDSVERISTLSKGASDGEYEKLTLSKGRHCLATTDSRCYNPPKDDETDWINACCTEEWDEEFGPEWCQYFHIPPTKKLDIGCAMSSWIAEDNYHEYSSEDALRPARVALTDARAISTSLHQWRWYGPSNIQWLFQNVKAVPGQAPYIRREVIVGVERQSMNTIKHEYKIGDKNWYNRLDYNYPDSHITNRVVSTKNQNGSYVESYAPTIDGIGVNLANLRGVMVHCVAGQSSDWCALSSRNGYKDVLNNVYRYYSEWHEYNEDIASAEASISSMRVKKGEVSYTSGDNHATKGDFKDLVDDGLYLPIKKANTRLVSNNLYYDLDVATDVGQNRYHAKMGSLGEYFSSSLDKASLGARPTIDGHDKDYDGPWKDWTYIQLTWSSPEKDQVDYKFGPKSLKWSDDLSSNAKSVLFTGTGWDSLTGKCKNVLTGTPGDKRKDCWATDDVTSTPKEPSTKGYRDNGGTRDLACIHSGDDVWDCPPNSGVWDKEDNKFKTDYTETDDENGDGEEGGKIDLRGSCQKIDDTETRYCVNVINCEGDGDCANKGMDGFSCEKDVDPETGELAGQGVCVSDYESRETTTKTIDKAFCFMYPVNSGLRQTCLDTLQLNDNNKLFGYCPAGGDGQNYWGLRLLFDEQGDYRGTWFSLCDGTGSLGWQDLAIDFITEDFCAVPVLVNQRDENGVYRNKARTQRIYQASLDAGGLQFRTGLEGTSPVGIRYASINTPLGALLGHLPNGVDYKENGTGYVSLATNKLNYIGYGDSQNLEARSLGSKFSEDNSGGMPWKCAPQPDIPKNSFVFKGRSTNTPGCQSMLTNKLTDFFAQIYTSWRLTNDTGMRAKYAEIGDYVTDDSDTLEHEPPRIAGALITDSLDSKGKPIYKMVPNVLVANEHVGGDFTISAGDPLFLTFYAWAADDQMPIKRITIDWWGNETDLNPAEGFYKNHKPLCQTKANDPMGVCLKTESFYESSSKYGDSNIVFSGAACYTDEDCARYYDDGSKCTPANVAHFGDSPDACTESYFKYQTYYQGQCKSEMRPCADVDANGKYDTNCWNPTVGAEGMCQFVPRVQVLDNWGWCNGTCRTSGGCWSGDKDNGDFDFCDPGYPEDHWLNYSGVIYVRP